MPTNRSIQAGCLLVLLILCGAAHLQAVDARLTRLVSSGGFILTKDDGILAQYSPNEFFVPASIIKIATALATLEIFGPDHHFKTEFYLRGKTTLCIKGYGDPFLVSEEVAACAAALKARGLTRVEEIILDNDYFDHPGPGDGNSGTTNPYDAVNDALAVNFSALPLVKSVAGHISSGEAQTPLIPLMQEIGNRLKPGRYRVNVSAFPEPDGTANNLRYTAQLFTALLRAEGIEVADHYNTGPVQRGDRLLYSHTGRTSVSELVHHCLVVSNNFIANQLYLSCGAEMFGPPATWPKAHAALTAVLHRRLGRSADFRFTEGSGLSRNNRVTPASMIALLNAFKPYSALLKRRGTILLKSGTMTGIYAYAGYFRSGTDLDPFVVILNQPRNTRDALLQQLHSIYVASSGPGHVLAEP